MITLKNKDVVSILNGTMSAEDLLNFYPVQPLIADLVELLKNNRTVAKPIVLNEDEYKMVMSLFKIRGYNAQGQPELRGRKRKDEKTLKD